VHVNVGRTMSPWRDNESGFLRNPDSRSKSERFATSSGSFCGTQARRKLQRTLSPSPLSLGWNAPYLLSFGATTRPEGCVSLRRD